MTAEPIPNQDLRDCWYTSITFGRQKSLGHTQQGDVLAVSQLDGMQMRSDFLRSGSQQATAAFPSLLGYRAVLWAPRPVHMQTGHLRALQEMPE